ncbi:MAG: hypothetical protein BJ554DRAFT_1613, partial [Olpidium bornovanus]
EYLGGRVGGDKLRPTADTPLPVSARPRPPVSGDKLAGPLLDGLSATAALFNSTCNPFLFLFDKNIKSAIQDATGCTSKLEESGRSSPVKRRSSATAPWFCGPRIWRWRRKAKPRKQRNWMDIAVNVTVDGVNNAAERGAARAGSVLGAVSVRVPSYDRGCRPQPAAHTSSIRGADALNVGSCDRGIQLPPATRTSSVRATEAADVARDNRCAQLAPAPRSSSVPGAEAVQAHDNVGAQPVAADSREDRPSPFVESDQRSRSPPEPPAPQGHTAAAPSGSDPDGASGPHTRPAPPEGELPEPAVKQTSVPRGDPPSLPGLGPSAAAAVPDVVGKEP